MSLGECEVHDDDCCCTCCLIDLSGGTAQRHQVLTGESLPQVSARRHSRDLAWVANPLSLEPPRGILWLARTVGDLIRAREQWEREHSRRRLPLDSPGPTFDPYGDDEWNPYWDPPPPFPEPPPEPEPTEEEEKIDELLDKLIDLLKAGAGLTETELVEIKYLIDDLRGVLRSELPRYKLPLDPPGAPPTVVEILDELVRLFYRIGITIGGRKLDDHIAWAEIEIIDDGGPLRGPRRRRVSAARIFIDNTPSTGGCGFGDVDRALRSVTLWHELLHIFVGDQFVGQPSDGDNASTTLGEKALAYELHGYIYVSAGETLCAMACKEANGERRKQLCELADEAFEDAADEFDDAAAAEDAAAETARNEGDVDGETAAEMRAADLRKHAAEYRAMTCPCCANG